MSLFTIYLTRQLYIKFYSNYYESVVNGQGATLPFEPQPLGIFTLRPGLRAGPGLGALSSLTGFSRVSAPRPDAMASISRLVTAARYDLFLRLLLKEKPSPSLS